MRTTILPVTAATTPPPETRSQKEGQAMTTKTRRDDQPNQARLRASVSSHLNLVALLMVDIALFVMAELTYKSAKHPGTVSNIAWYAFLIGAATLVVLVIVAIAPSRSQRHAR